jgi:hypothetical protein
MTRNASSQAIVCGCRSTGSQSRRQADQTTTTTPHRRSSMWRRLPKSLGLTIMQLRRRAAVIRMAMCHRFLCGQASRTVIVLPLSPPPDNGARAPAGDRRYDKALPDMRTAALTWHGVRLRQTSRDPRPDRQKGRGGSRSKRWPGCSIPTSTHLGRGSGSKSTFPNQ